MWLLSVIRSFFLNDRANDQTHIAVFACCTGQWVVKTSASISNLLATNWFKQSVITNFFLIPFHGKLITDTVFWCLFLQWNDKNFFLKMNAQKWAAEIVSKIHTVRVNLWVHFSHSNSLGKLINDFKRLANEENTA